MTRTRRFQAKGTSTAKAAGKGIPGVSRWPTIPQDLVQAPLTLIPTNQNYHSLALYAYLLTSIHFGGAVYHHHPLSVVHQSDWWEGTGKV